MTRRRASGDDRQRNAIEDSSQNFSNRHRSHMITQKTSKMHEHYASPIILTSIDYVIWLVVWTWMLFSHTLGTIIPTYPNWRTHIFQRGRLTTNQTMSCCEVFQHSWLKWGNSSRPLRSRRRSWLGSWCCWKPRKLGGRALISLFFFRKSLEEPWKNHGKATFFWGKTWWKPCKS